ncbi:hypothetical protein [Rubrivivax gelatinosus]|uniref:Uncharacterized protein n=1 Tax=Rubrivivax gelatinosus TaxID=28068 RepID=A0A4R2MGB6_RUBGE|nr:hypothetical protein [Rubrivivax gelatinosus]TCP01786.1 hypothetical protein EV684_108127 [Rubrivivax gelatinosus]
MTRLHAAALLAALATATSLAAAQAPAGGATDPAATGQRQGSETTPSTLPPGATSDDGNKAAVPASGVPGTRPGDLSRMPADPATGSTPGQPPGVGSPADKAMTPRGRGSAASAPTTGR